MVELSFNLTHPSFKIEIAEVPGIGEKNKHLLAEFLGTEEPILTTHQLLGKFLMCKGRDESGDLASQMAHCDKFWHWLKSKNLVRCFLHT